MRRRDPFGEAVEAVRAKVRSGALAPGEPVLVEDLARELALSPTPVREALAHLAGRGVIEGRRAGGRGHGAWLLAAPDLADLYRLQDAVAGFAALSGMFACLGAEAGASEAVGEPALRAERYFERLARRTGNALLLQVQSVLSDRLHLIRRLEPAVLPDALAELAALEAHDGREQNFVATIGAYHQRRIAAADLLVRAAAARRL